MEKKKNPRFGDIDLDLFVKPDIKKIPCRDCKYRENDRFGGKVKGATLGVCQKFFTKPNNVIYQGEDCEEWESEEDITDDE